MRISRFILLSAVFCTLVSGTPFTKPATHRRPAPAADKPSAASVYDTVTAPSPDSIAVSGFEKTLRSSRESMYISNLTADSLAGLGIEITYMDMDRRMLHKSVHDLAEAIPAGETRLVDVPSFDRQALYYYHLSPLPPRARHATPFRASVRVIYVVRRLK